jgi:5,10-methylenetetrahydromethanopterin reductase
MSMSKLGDGGTPEAFALVPPVPGVGQLAAIAESEGFDGIALPDSQNLAGELISGLAAAAARTTTLKLAAGVANPVTRHPAVLASAVANLQADSGGRIELGLGRGDSALAYIGRGPAPLGYFERYLRAVQGYLRGDPVPFDAGFSSPEIPSIDAHNLAVAPESSQLLWTLAFKGSPVPVYVAATGPKVLALAAHVADGALLCVGASPERVEWAAGVITAERQDAQITQAFRLSAIINIAVRPDVATAFDLVRGGLTSFARYSTMGAAPAPSATAEDRVVLASLEGAYDMTAHAAATASHAGLVTQEFAERNAVIGDADRCISKLRRLWDLGVRRFVFFEDFGRDGDAGQSHRDLVERVLPELRTWR